MEDGLAGYLSRVLDGPVEVRGVRPLGGSAGAGTDPKGFGYGVPLEVECVVGGVVRNLVMARTRVAQGFGHDYPADRAWQALYGHRAYNGFPRHVRSLDVGFIGESGALASVADASEFFQLVEKADGRLYWLDLNRLLTGLLTSLDLARARELGCFLARAHEVKRAEPTLYERHVRELIGHGECLMGILDSYPHPYAPLPPEVCEAIEHDAVSWRWRVRGRAHRLSRVHGDFHPWNLLFREGTDFSVLDRSRVEWGEPADDVAALGVNHLFFGLRRAEAEGRVGVAEPFLTLFRVFLDAYTEDSHDHELLEVLPPFLAFRALVIAHPRWYPNISLATRRALIGFARALMAGGPFVPEQVQALLGGRP